MRAQVCGNRPELAIAVTSLLFFVDVHGKMGRSGYCEVYSGFQPKGDFNEHMS